MHLNIDIWCISLNFHSRALVKMSHWLVKAQELWGTNKSYWKVENYYCLEIFVETHMIFRFFVTAHHSCENGWFSFFSLTDSNVLQENLSSNTWLSLLIAMPELLLWWWTFWKVARQPKYNSSSLTVKPDHHPMQRPLLSTLIPFLSLNFYTSQNHCPSIMIVTLSSSDSCTSMDDSTSSTMRVSLASKEMPTKTTACSSDSPSSHGKKSVSFAPQMEDLIHSAPQDSHGEDSESSSYSSWYSRQEYRAFRQDYIESAKQVARWNRQHKKHRQNKRCENEPTLLEAFQACCASSTATASYSTSSLYHYDLLDDVENDVSNHDEDNNDDAPSEDCLLERLLSSNPKLVLPDSSVVGLERMAARSIALDKQHRRKQLLQQAMAITKNTNKNDCDNNNNTEDTALLLQRACESISRPSRLFARHLAQAAAQAAWIKWYRRCRFCSFTIHTILLGISY